MLLNAQLAENVKKLGFKFGSANERELGTGRLKEAIVGVYVPLRGSLAEVTYDGRTGNTKSKISEDKLGVGEKSVLEELVKVMAETLKRDKYANNTHLQLEQEIEHPISDLTLIY